MIISLSNDNDEDILLKKKKQRKKSKVLGVVFLCFIIVASGTYATSSLLRRSEPDRLVRPTQVANQMLIPVQKDIPPTQPVPSMANAQSTPRINAMGIVIPTPRVNSATPTPNANANPYPPHTGQLVLDDPLRDNSRGYGWDDYPPNSNSDSCQFVNGAYHATSQQYFQVCYPTLHESNFAFEAQMQIVNGNCGGLMVRSISDGQSGYFMEICHDGSYQFYLYGSGPTKELTSGSNQAIITGLGQSNLIAIVANGSMFDLYVNHQQITSVQDSTFSQGLFGVCSGTYAEAAYTDARGWTL